MSRASAGWLIVATSPQSSSPQSGPSKWPPSCPPSSSSQPSSPQPSQGQEPSSPAQPFSLHSSTKSKTQGLRAQLGVLIGLLGSANGAFSVPQPLLRTALRQTRPLLDDNWVFAYAETRPYNETTAEGAAFLATNALYPVAGVALGAQDPVFGAIIECATAGSLLYHYSQLHLGGSPQRQLVKLCMLIDYIFAIPALIYGTFYAASLGAAVPLGAEVCAVLAFASLLAGWIWTSPREYIVLHGLWHIFGASAGILMSTVAMP